MDGSIVVPSDGSEFGNRALPVALALARRRDAEVHLVHVREPLLFPHGESAYELHHLDSREKQVRADLTRAAAHFAQDASVRVDAVFLDGPAVASLQRYLDDARPDLVVMMTHGRGGVSRAWLGSIVDGLIQCASVPLLFLRRDTTWAREAAEPLFRRVLIALDGSAMAEQVLDHVFSLGTPAVTEYVLLSVVAPHHAHDAVDAATATGVGRSHDEEQRDAAHNDLERVAADLRSRGAHVTVRVEVHRDTAQGIVDAATEHHVEMIALSTHGRGRVARFMHGGIADTLVRVADVPILVYRPREAATAGPESQGTAAG